MCPIHSTRITISPRSCFLSIDFNKSILFFLGNYWEELYTVAVTEYIISNGETENFWAAALKSHPFLAPIMSQYGKWLQIEGLVYYLPVRTRYDVIIEVHRGHWRSGIIQIQTQLTLWSTVLSLCKDEDIKSGFSIKFDFDKNEYFTNSTIIKKYHMNAEGEVINTTTPITWKPVSSN